jgi:hypothetical protein
MATLIDFIHYLTSDVLSFVIGVPVVIGAALLARRYNRP